MTTRERYDWWTSLRHGGLLIAPGKLDQYFSAEIPPLLRRQMEQLRRDLTRFVADNSQALTYLLDTVLEDVLDLDRRLWFKGNQIGPEWSQKAITGEIIRPRRIWVDAHEHAFPVFVERDITRIGVGRGRRTVSRVVEWLRKADQKVALLTNGHQWRLIHAGADYDAWVESDTEQWFVEGQPSSQVDALRILLNPSTLGTDSAEETPLLWAAIQASRQGQAEISSELGERVRQAVERLIRESSVSIDNIRAETVFTNNDLYIAANRMIMRCVIILFAEARDLLPRDNITYHNSYGLQGLREQLDRLAGGRAQERLRHSYSAWPRLLALFQLMYYGSLHEALPIPTYGGQLFAPGNATAPDGVTRALIAFEQIYSCPSDAAVYRILELLTKSKIKVRQGNRSTWVDAPVDFSDLSTEYIGILYQGLLDFELRQAEANEPMIFLNLGNQPVLPLSRLESMDDDALSTLVDKFKSASKPVASDDEEESDDEEAEELDTDDDEETEENDDEEDTEPEVNVDEEEDIDVVLQLRERAEVWAGRAVRAGNLVSKPRSRSREAIATYEAEVAAFAPRLIARIILPGEWFLVRWGGTRKGSGTFYTRPQLGVPLVRRTLQPLAYQQKGDDDWIPRLPEEILDLKVCDSAMGSASLLVAALRYLTGALYESLFYHDRISAHGEQGICRLADGQLTNELIDESLPVPPDSPEFEDRLLARLKRYVVERCVYGVDLNPLAVELARLSLWIETMDPRLPFSFLDHKLKVGNALVGCWLDRFQDYPVMAWEREGGDKNHDRFVHHYREYTAARGKNKGQVERRGDKWTQAIKERRDEKIRPEMTVWIQQLGTRMMTFGEVKASATDLHAVALQAFEKMHRLALTDPGQQAAVYYEQIVENPAYKQLKLAFDTWCAIWFWPGDELAQAPTPLNFQALPEETAVIVQQVANRQGFFHWELEFPDVFNPQRSGFDAIVGNPPWENAQPNPEEFFSNEDTLFRTYGRLVKQDWMNQKFDTNSSLEIDWIKYQADFKNFSNWVKYSSNPFGVGLSDSNMPTTKGASKSQLRYWRNIINSRVGYLDENHPYQLQVGRIFTYKLFLEQTAHILRRGGRIGALVPSGIYSDSWSASIRKFFLDKCKWEMLFSYINENRIFTSIHHSFRYCFLIVEKQGVTENINTAFSRYDIEDWENHKQFTFTYAKLQVSQFSPNSRSLLEFPSKEDLQVIKKIYDNSVLLGTKGEEGWNIKFSLEFMMNTDASLFPPRPKWETQGYHADQYGHWIKGKWVAYDKQDSHPTPVGTFLSADRKSIIFLDDIEDIALPLYEGRMIGQFDFSQKGWISGKGRTAKWREIPFENKQIEPQYLMRLDTATTSNKGYPHPKVAYMKVSSASNTRTVISNYLNLYAGGDSVVFFRQQTGKLQDILVTVSYFNSLVFDYAVRIRLGGLNVSEFLMVESPAPIKKRTHQVWKELIGITCRLGLCHDLFAREWLTLLNHDLFNVWGKSWALTLHERLRLRVILDVLYAEIYGLSSTEFSQILLNCDCPSEQLSSSNFIRTLNPKGFWRVDKAKDPELRHTVLSLIAFHDLKEKGLDAFLAQNNGEGWMLPETLRLADYGLGHDDRAKEHQPVASRLGPRFLPWQLEATPEQSWAECERHAENLRLLLGDLIQEPKPEPTKLAETRPDYSPATNLLGEPIQKDLFGNITDPKKRRK